MKKEKVNKERKKENKAVKNKLILCSIGTILGLIKVPALLLLEQVIGFSNWISFAYIVIYYIAFRFLILGIQKVLVSTKVLKYTPDDFSMYSSDKKIREEYNIKYKMSMDRFYSRLCYMICYLTVFIVSASIWGNVGVGTAIFLVLLLNIPLIIASKPPIKSYHTYYSGNGSYTNSNYYTSSSNSSSSSYFNNDNKKKDEPSLGDVSTSYFKNGDSATSMQIGGTLKDYTGISSIGEVRDKYGRKVGTSTTYDLGYGISTTVYKDKDGNKVEETKIKW